ncbi:S-layer family protein [Tumebacillus sp. BK434]|uniref:S-layer homology domain-containing protein n=1 Tax=Tumebacillus sp. BK434 TaxID=2512169 RepID=UPI0010CE2E77|nr:S-layer homology domain-containing protein [Tumebacillus sp. BK434]TCP53840.1 S-layer family protein [Tumebacillus sp. BK434]
MKKRIASLLLATVLLAPQASVFAADDTATVKVRLAGLNGDHKEVLLNVGQSSFKNNVGEVITMQQPTAMGALMKLLAQDGTTYEAKTLSFGSYITKVGKLAEKELNANSGWSVWVNGKPPGVAAETFELKDGDEVVWGYYDYTQTLFPEVSFSTKSPTVGTPFTVNVTAEQTTYDAEWNPIISTVKIDKADVRTASNGSKLTETNAEGTATLQADQAGLLQLYIDKTDSVTGVPQLLRTGTLNLLVGNPNALFDDLGSFKWAESSILDLAKKGVVSGNGNGQYEPKRAVLRSELAKILALAEGDLNFGGTKSFSDVKATNGYKTFIETVVERGLMSGDKAGTFRPNSGLTREELAVVLVNFSGVELSNTKNLLPFYDRNSISGWAQPYVKTAVDKGLLAGDAENTFRPHDVASRAEVATAIVNVINKQSK